jgi:hypothetical protein
MLPDDPGWGFARSAPVDGFSLRYVRRGRGPAVVNVLTDPNVAYPRRSNLG